MHGSRSKPSSLGAAQALKLLQPLAWWLHTQGRKEAVAAEILPLLTAPLRELGRNPEEGEALLEAIRDQSGLLVNAGPAYAFLHLSFQERLLRAIPGWDAEGKAAVRSLLADPDAQVAGMAAEVLGIQRPASPRARRHEPAPGEERLHEEDGTVLLYVPGGEYTLGAEDISREERPVHRVGLSPFWIAKYPVTNEQYSRFLGANPGAREPEVWSDKQFNQPEQPVVGVTWEEAQAYCRWAGLHLPSEAQWEAAARGTDGRRYPWGNGDPTPEHANFGNREGRPTPVGSYPKGAGPYGALDQVGNVWEWCEDVWDAAAYRNRDGQRDPLCATGDAAVRCLRGGSWSFVARYLAVAFRNGDGASYRSGGFGFRCLLPAGPEP